VFDFVRSTSGHFVGSLRRNHSRRAAAGWRDGIEFLREIQTAPSTVGTPVLLLSSEAEVRDRVRGLNTGAEDYVGKPYDQSYVVARARRTPAEEETRKRFRNVENRPHH